MSDYDHQSIVSILRSLDSEEHSKIRKWVDVLNDKDVIAQLFTNVRRHDGETRGNLLSNLGAKTLKTIWTHWEIKLDKPLTGRQQLRFARANRLPYRYTSNILLTFDKEVGIWLAMIRGNISLMDNVLPEY